MATGSGSRSAYKERLSFPDPLSKESTSRTTWYRLKKKRKLAEAETEGYVVDSGELHRERSASRSSVGSELSDSDSVLDDPDSLHQFVFRQEPVPLDDFFVTVHDCHEPDNDDMHTESPVSDDELDNDVTSNPLPLEAGQLLYDSSSLTVPASCLLIKKFALRHNLTQVAVGDLLQLIRLHCPPPNHCPTSVYQFNKVLGDLKQPSRYHYYCADCLQQISGSEINKCPNTSCKKDLSTADAKCMFMEIPVEDQLQTLLESKFTIMFMYIRTTLYICKAIVVLLSVYKHVKTA